MTRIRVNGVDLEYVEEGRGVPVVFSHGGGSDVRYWEPQRKSFSDRYRFVAYSRRFHGAMSSATEGDYSAESHVADLLAVIRRLGAEPVHLVGFSTAIALRAVLDRPELVRTLTIIEPNVPWLLEGDEAGEAVLASWRRQNDRLRAEAGDDAYRYAALWFDLVNNQGPDRFVAQRGSFRQMWIENMTATRPPAGEASPLRCDRLRSIAVPTLAIGAELGMPYSRLIVERLASCLPHCQLVVVPGVTHFMSDQAPGTFNETVLAFLDRHAVGGNDRARPRSRPATGGSP